MKTVKIIGGGAAGLAAAVFAAEAGLGAELYEKNEKLGKKLYITGKGRCNFTNCTPVPEFLEKVVTNRKFLYSALYGFDSFQTLEFFERLGLKTKVERGNRAFPESDRASDVTKALETRARELGVRIFLNTPVRELPRADREHPVIIATGGLSYPSTGSTGDGYRFAKETGHRIVPTRPALVSLMTREAYIPPLQGISLKNVSLTLKAGKKVLYDGFGEMLFTHFGISGPLVLAASSLVGKELEKGPLEGSIDFKPALTPEMLDARLLREFDEEKNRRFKNAVAGLLPARLLTAVLSLCDADPEAPVNRITKEQRQQFAGLLKAFPMTVTKTGPYTEAVITQGGVGVKDIDPKTMESRLVPGLYFIGEVLDIDALTGGYNLQLAWSTAYAAAQAIAKEV